MKKVFDYDYELELESGQVLPRLTLTYHTFGTLAPDKSNVVWIVHALTANSNPLEWWPEIVGPGLAIDTDKYFVVCANMLGSHYGSTSPLSHNPVTNRVYFHDFPVLTNRDIANSFDLLADHLELEYILTLIGPSIGGQQALEWSIISPQRIKNMVLIATNAVHSPYGIAWNESQRMAIEADSTWLTDDTNAGKKGMEAARSIALISYRTKSGYDTSQKRALSNSFDNDYKVSSYQRYQGKKLADRFNAYSYYLLTQMMDSHDVGRNRYSRELSLTSIQAKTLVIGVESDILFPLEEQQFLTDHIVDSSLSIVSSNLGHDGFLTEYSAIGDLLAGFIQNTSISKLSAAV